MLRSPLTTSGHSDQSLLVVSDGCVEGTRTTEGIVGRESACNLEPLLLFRLWLCNHCLFCDYVRVRMRVSPCCIHSMPNEKLTSRREESGEEDETADEWSQTHYDLVPYPTAMRGK